MGILSTRALVKLLKAKYVKFTKHLHQVTGTREKKLVKINHKLKEDIKEEKIKISIMIAFCLINYYTSLKNVVENKYKYKLF